MHGGRTHGSAPTVFTENRVGADPRVGPPVQNKEVFMPHRKELLEKLKAQRPAAWDQLPDFALYMDQVLSYMDRQVIPYGEDDALTASMVNNYTKSGLVPRAEGKKYGKEHLAYLTGICVLKHVLTTRDMDLLIREELEGGGHTVEDGYAAFCDSLARALSTVTDEMEKRPEEENLADAAIHFALLSYAAGMASNRYISLLKAERGITEEGKKKKKGK